MNRPWILLAWLVSACARTPAPDASPPASGASASAPLEPSGPVAEASRVADALGEAAAASSADGAVGELPLEGENFAAQARVLFRVAACGPEGEIPTRFDAAVVAKHCEELGHAYDDYRRTWLELAKPFFAALRPKDLPTQVVYPFGGGDLVSALATFPEASEVTTLSLEPAGDIRPIDRLAPERLARELSIHRSHLERLFAKAHSRTDNLEKESQAEVPGEVLFGLGALVVHGAVPVALRYFRLKPDGEVAYVSAADIDAEAHHPKALRSLFDDVEIRFRKTGDAGGPVQVLRHIAFNLDDDHLKADPAVLAYLNTHLGPGGKVATMTKAATHLLWNSHFSTIRGWLSEHTDWMASDSTGIPPRFAVPAGFIQDPDGKFDGPSPFGFVDDRDAADVKLLFSTRNPPELAFRYGYPDKDGHAHLIITHR